MKSDEISNLVDIVAKLCEFMEFEARSCSMDYGCVTPLYVFRSWGGQVPLEDIASAMRVVKLPV